jgi:hypothetical protein
MNADKYPLTIPARGMSVQLAAKAAQLNATTPLPLAGEGLKHIAGFDFKSPAAAPVMI